MHNSITISRGRLRCIIIPSMAMKLWALIAYSGCRIVSKTQFQILYGGNLRFPPYIGNEASALSLLYQPNKKERHQPFLFMSGLLDSNQRPRAPQTCTLPTELNPDLRAKTSLSSFRTAKVLLFFEITKFFCIKMALLLIFS